MALLSTGFFTRYIFSSTDFTFYSIPKNEVSDSFFIGFFCRVYILRLFILTGKFSSLKLRNELGIRTVVRPDVVRL